MRGSVQVHSVQVIEPNGLCPHFSTGPILRSQNRKLLTPEQKFGSAHHAMSLLSEMGDLALSLSPGKPGNPVQPSLRPCGCCPS